MAMFCPKCGKDCGSENFCSKCGTQLQQAAQESKQTVWKLGMPCPNCGGTERIQDIPRRTNTKKGSTDIPTSGGYLGVNGSVILSDSAVSICVNSGFKKHRIQIPFDQLVTVVYSRPTLKPRSYGALLFRGESNKEVPIPGERNLLADHATITISTANDTLFYHIFQMLKAVAPPTTKFEMITHQNRIKGLEEMARGIDLDYFFGMYAPYRERAADGIHAKFEIPREAARVLVDRVFDAQQKILYAVDSLDAIRDLNLVVADMRRKEQRVNRQEAESRKRQEQDAIRSSLERLERMKTIEMLDDYLDKHGR